MYVGLKCVVRSVTVDPWLRGYQSLVTSWDQNVRELETERESLLSLFTVDYATSFLTNPQGTSVVN